MYFTCYVQRLLDGINHCVKFLLRRIYKLFRLVLQKAKRQLKRRIRFTLH